MKRIIFAMIILFSFHAKAYEEVWKLGDHFLAMEKNESKNLLISKSCTETTQEPTCQAMKALKIASIKSIPGEKFLGGKNPGAVACTESAKGKIVYLKDLSGNENTFCFFEDKTMVSTGTMAVYADINDKGKK